jgi:hypothetical protein
VPHLCQPSTSVHCTALHCTALHCTALHYTALHYTADGVCKLVMLPAGDLFMRALQERSLYRSCVQCVQCVQCVCTVQCTMCAVCAVCAVQFAMCAVYEKCLCRRPLHGESLELVRRLSMVCRHGGNSGRGGRKLLAVRTKSRYGFSIVDGPSCRSPGGLSGMVTLSNIVLFMYLAVYISELTLQCTMALCYCAQSSGNSVSRPNLAFVLHPTL